jgi:hypothetical protein
MKCEICNFECVNKSDLDRHFESEKHLFVDAINEFKKREEDFKRKLKEAIKEKDEEIKMRKEIEQQKEKIIQEKDEINNTKLEIKKIKFLENIFTEKVI